ncbi:MAG: alkaline phosphatase [Bacteroides sp.]|nr:alkaline phosphatase [Bacteroides sp.]MCM1085921.1 alkaline phosphatase [Bacteroides sp.]
MKLKKTAGVFCLLLLLALLGQGQNQFSTYNRNEARENRLGMETIGSRQFQRVVFKRFPSNIKNVIVMIPDGCSTELLAVGRWMNNGLPLALDSRIRGLVRTYCSDSPIGDSAPTGSTYATGHRSQDGFVATYPARSMDSTGLRFNTDTALAYQPMFTLLEAARLQGKATGMVVTCYFPHATPADFLAHTPKRNQYARIAKQMVHHPCDLLLGGGAYWIDSSLKTGYDAVKELEGRDIFYTKRFSEARQDVDNGNYRIWGLFSQKEMDYEIDRDPQEQPSLEEMTRLAIEALSQQENGFFLMVEGSKVDWGAHNNDLPATVFDFLAFDRAVGAAMEFAKKDGQTLVVVMPDHQTGGLSLGNRRLNSGYAQTSAEELFEPLRNCKASYEKTVKDLFAQKSGKPLGERLRQSVKANFGIDSLPAEDLARLTEILKEHKDSRKSVRALSEVLNRHFYLGWTTFGHNGGDVMFATYHPQGDELKGLIDNEEIAPYICRQAELGNLDSLTQAYYAPLHRVFPQAETNEILFRNAKHDESEDPLYIELVLENGKRLKLFPNTDRAQLNKKKITLPGICIYNGKGFYLPMETVNLVK